MSRYFISSPAVLLGAGLLGLAALPAAAGECPAGQAMTDALTSGATAPKDVTDTVISSIDLAAYDIDGRLFRLRRLEVKPGGIVPWHSHAERPAHIFILEGEITEYASDCKVPILHKAGEVVAEEGKKSHWWKNDGKKTAVLLSADILPPDGKPEESM